MLEIEAINTVRQSFNMIYDMLLKEAAENENICLDAFRYRMNILDNSKVTMNEELDFMIMLLIRREAERGMLDEGII